MNRVAGIGGAIQARSRLMPEGVNIAISSGGVEALWTQIWVIGWGTPPRKVSHAREALAREALIIPSGEGDRPVQVGRSHMSDRMQYGLGAAISLIMVLTYLGLTAPERNNPEAEGAPSTAPRGEQALTVSDNQPAPSARDVAIPNQPHVRWDELAGVRDAPLVETQTVASEGDPNQSVASLVKPASTSRTVGETDTRLKSAEGETSP